MRILIVEDEVGIANFIRQGLEEEDYKVDVADEGERGMELSLSGNYDLLLLDWMIPGHSGIDICVKVKEVYPDLPVILLTAKDTIDETVYGLKSGANDYIKKPFHFEELLERVRVQLRSKVKPEYTYKDLSLNIPKHLVIKNGMEIPLTKKEFDLLEYLLRNKGKVCKRAEIIQHVWDIHFEYDTGVIDVYINALRKKLSKIDGEDYVHTVRGLGYLIKQE